MIIPGTGRAADSGMGFYNEPTNGGGLVATDTTRRDAHDDAFMPRRHCEHRRVICKAAGNGRPDHRCLTTAASPAGRAAARTAGIITDNEVGSHLNAGTRCSAHDQSVMASHSTDWRSRSQWKNAASR